MPSENSAVSGDDLPASVNANVGLSMGDNGNAALDLIGEVQNTVADLAIQKKKLNDAGYELTLSTDADGQLVADVSTK